MLTKDIGNIAGICFISGIFSLPSIRFK